MSKHTFEIAVALVQRGDNWLVARRLADAHLGGLWEFPGGKREPDETAAAAAIRELREECGVEAVVERVLEPTSYEYADRRVNITPVICHWAAGEPQPRGSETCRWVTLAELRELQMPPVNTEIIRQLGQDR